jgi:hypothetical protein
MTFFVFFVVAVILVVGGHILIIGCAVTVWSDVPRKYRLFTRGATLALTGLLVATDIWFVLSLPSHPLAMVGLLGYYTIAIISETGAVMWLYAASQEQRTREEWTTRRGS